ncbi:hypothetical protein E2562_020059 [Oryza meyeriana var. granulata]|uniref:Uncharacterized protein n=1 Tax=Oryza meyeriana var. granulata TaxID=110450 RepID=A0A6G1BYG4_9ORYZ|nr:hypothetical protein E2562_020059 [Oryza meyeriana var. granulata]
MTQQDELDKRPWNLALGSLRPSRHCVAAHSIQSDTSLAKETRRCHLLPMPTFSPAWLLPTSPRYLSIASIFLFFLITTQFLISFLRGPSGGV